MFSKEKVTARKEPSFINKSLTRNISRRTKNLGFAQLFAGAVCFAFPPAMVFGIPLIVSGGATISLGQSIPIASRLWDHKKRADWNDARIKQESAITTPQIIAACTIFHENCSSDQREEFIKNIHKLYEIESNRPSMDIAARGLKQSKPRLIIEVGDKQNLGITREDIGGYAAPNPDNRNVNFFRRIFRQKGYYGGGEIAIVFNERHEQNKYTLIHEITHYATYKVKHNDSKVYNTKDEKEQYKAMLKSSEESEINAFTENEIFIVQKMNEPFLRSLYAERGLRRFYKERSAWKKERHVRIAEIITEFGEAPLEKLYPEELKHFKEQFNAECKQYLQRKGYSANMANLVTSEHDVKNDCITVSSMVSFIKMKAQYRGWGTIRQNLPTTADSFFKKIEKSLIAIIPSFAKDITLLENACTELANHLSSGFVKENGRFLFKPDRLKDFNADNFLKEILSKNNPDTSQAKEAENNIPTELNNSSLEALTTKNVQMTI